MAIVTDAGRKAVATAVKEKTIFIGIGQGDVSWDTTPENENVADTALVSPLGYRKADQVLYCKPDPNGDILVPTGNFSVSDLPTNYLYLSFQFAFADASDKIIRESAVFLNTVVNGSDDGYLAPSAITNVGDMLILEHLRIIRYPEVRQQFEFILQF